MAKLLEFKPNEQKTEVKEGYRDHFENLLTIDVLYGVTPDIPRLRYAGPQEVFVWDDMKCTPVFDTRLGVEQETDYFVLNYDAVTNNSFTPFENWKQNANEHQFFLPLVSHWMDSFRATDVEAMVKVPAQPVSGRVLKVGLKTLCALDQWYGNTENFRRQLIPVNVPNYQTSGKVMKWVWAYICPTDALGKYNPHDKQYEMRASIQPRPIRSIGRGTGNYFEVDAFRKDLRTA